MSGTGRRPLARGLWVTRQAILDFLNLAIDELSTFELFVEKALSGLRASPHLDTVAVDPFDLNHRVVRIGGYAVFFQVGRRGAITLEKAVPMSNSWWTRHSVPDYLSQQYVLGRLAGKRSGGGPR